MTNRAIRPVMKLSLFDFIKHFPQDSLGQNARLCDLHEESKAHKVQHPKPLWSPSMKTPKVLTMECQSSEVIILLALAICYNREILPSAGAWLSLGLTSSDYSTPCTHCLQPQTTHKFFLKRNRMNYTVTDGLQEFIICINFSHRSRYI